MPANATTAATKTRCASVDYALRTTTMVGGRATECWTRTNKNGSKYVTCEDSSGRKPKRKSTRRARSPTPSRDVPDDSPSEDEAVHETNRRKARLIQQRFGPSSSTDMAKRIRDRRARVAAAKRKEQRDLLKFANELRTEGTTLRQRQLARQYVRSRMNERDSGRRGTPVTATRAQQKAQARARSARDLQTRARTGAFEDTEATGGGSNPYRNKDGSLKAGFIVDTNCPSH